VSKRRRRNNFDWISTVLALLVLALFTASGFIWGLNVGVKFF
jgi:hypothetical protein